MFGLTQRLAQRWAGKVWHQIICRQRKGLRGTKGNPFDTLIRDFATHQRRAQGEHIISSVAS